MSVRGLLRNWPYKLIAILTAVILTTYVHSERNPWTSLTVDAPVQSIRLQEGFVNKINPDRISISLTGPKNEVDAVASAIQSGEIRPIVDLNGLTKGIHSLPVQLSIPDVVAKKVTTETRRVRVTIEDMSSRTMPVEVKIKNSPPIGFSVGGQTVNPGTATVSGASSFVKSVARLVVVVDPSPLRPSIDEYVSIKALNSKNEEVQNVLVRPNIAHVVLGLVEAPVSKPVYVSSNVVGQPEFPYKVAKITVTPGSVNIKGKPERLAGTTTISTDEVDVTGAMADVVRYVSLNVPPGVEIEGSNRVKVTVRIVPVQNP